MNSLAKSNRNLLYILIELTKNHFRNHKLTWNNQHFEKFYDRCKNRLYVLHFHSHPLIYYMHAYMVVAMHANDEQIYGIHE